MATITPNQIGFVSGNPTTTTVSFLVASFASSNVTVTTYSDSGRTAQVGSPVVITLSEYCADRGSNDPAGVQRVGYTGVGTMTGLSAGTRYYLKLQQGAVTETNATTYTAPAAGTDFRIWFMSCDEMFALEAGNAVEVGAFQYVYDYMTANPGTKQYVVFSDDLGYVDRNNVNAVSDIDDTGFSGKLQTGRPETTLKAYDYGVGYFCWLGMLGNTSDGNIHWGLDDRRNYVIRNATWFFMWGDHETDNNIGQMTAEAAVDHPAYAPGKQAWDGLVGRLRPTATEIRNRDTVAIHWGATLGDVRIVNLDCVTRSTGGYYSVNDPLGPYPSWPYEPTAVLGNDQIDDVLDALDTSHPFKFLVFPYIGERFWYDPADHSTEYLTGGAQYPLADFKPSEWARLYFNEGQSPQSLMENPNTNGTDGVLICCHGDIHMPMVQRHVGYADGDNGTGLRANWVTFYHAAATGQNNTNSQTDSWANISNRRYRGVEMLYHRFDPPGTSPRRKYYTCAFADVSGSTSPKELTMSLMVGDPDWVAAGNADAPRYSRRFRVGSNQPLGGDEMAPVRKSIELLRRFRVGPRL